MTLAVTATKDSNIPALAGRLSDIARLMDEQAEFHSGSWMEFGVASVRASANDANKRLRRASIAGPKLLREMEKTLMADLVRAASVASKVFDQAGDDGWPDLRQAADEIRLEIRKAARRDPGLFTPTDFDPTTFENAEVADMGTPGLWRRTEFGFVAPGPYGIPLCVMPFGVEENNWLSQIGVVGMAFHGSAGEAAVHAEKAAVATFGGESMH